MKTMTNETNGTIGVTLTAISWLLNIMNPSMIPIILSSAASIMAIINYYYQIKKNKK